MYYKESSSEGICPYNYKIFELKEEMHQKQGKISFPIGHLKTLMPMLNESERT